MTGLFRLVVPDEQRSLFHGKSVPGEVGWLGGQQSPESHGSTIITQRSTGQEKSIAASRLGAETATEFLLADPAPLFAQRTETEDSTRGALVKVRK